MAFSAEVEAVERMYGHHSAAMKNKCNICNDIKEQEKVREQNKAEHRPGTITLKGYIPGSNITIDIGPKGDFKSRTSSPAGFGPPDKQWSIDTFEAICDLYNVEKDFRQRLERDHQVPNASGEDRRGVYPFS